MHPDIYHRYEDRQVLFPPSAFQEDMISSVRPLSASARLNIIMLEKELRHNEPDDDERCGLLEDRYEVYVLKIETCRSHRLAVSIDRRSGQNEPPAMIHGAVSTDQACTKAMRLTETHRSLINPAWED